MSETERTVEEIYDDLAADGSTFLEMAEKINHISDIDKADDLRDILLDTFLTNNITSGLFQYGNQPILYDDDKEFINLILENSTFKQNRGTVRLN